MFRGILPLPIAVDRRDASWTVAEPLGMLEVGRKRTCYFSYPRMGHACHVVGADLIMYGDEQATITDADSRNSIKILDQVVAGNHSRSALGFRPYRTLEPQHH